MSGSSSPRGFWIFAALAVVAVAVIVFHQARNASAMHEDMQKLMARMESIEARTDQEGFGQASGPDGNRPSAGRPRTGGLVGQGPGPSAAGMAQQVQQDQARMRQELEALFKAQGPAPRTDSAPQQVTAAFGNEGVMQAMHTPTSKDVQCRARMCLIQGRFAPGEDGSDWATRVMLEVGRELPSYSVIGIPQPDGSFEVRIYAQRATGGSGQG